MEEAEKRCPDWSEGQGRWAATEYLAFRDFSKESGMGAVLDIERIARELGAERRGKVPAGRGHTVLPADWKTW